jgi:23S rRNA pseudouridine1911/1915/1917 synthase
VPEFVVDAEQAGTRVDKVITDWLAGTASRAAVQRWIDEQRVTIDGRPARAKEVVKYGQAVMFEAGPGQKTTAEADESVAVDVVWEDPHLLVVNKPAGLVVHPARGHRVGTLVNGLLARTDGARVSADEQDPEGALRPGIVHRIDKDTSGLLVVAKTDQSREGLKAQFAAHSIERSYWAATVGCPRVSKIDTFYGRHPTNRLKFTSRLSTGRRAVTNIEVVERFDGASIVHCRLETGRTHQIRVHLSEQADAPLLADRLYGKSTLPARLQAAVGELHRQALHAQVLGFVHPITGKALRFEVPLPDELVALRGRLSGLR